MIFAIKYYFSSTATWLGGTFKTKKANGLMNFIHNFTRLILNKQEKTALADITLCFQRIGPIGPIFVKIVAWQICFFAWNQQQTQNYCTIRLILMLRSENMPDTYKMQVCWLSYTKMMLLFRRPSTILVSYKHGKWTSQPRQTRKGDNLTKKGDISIELIHNKIKNWLRLYLNWHCVLS